MEFDVSGQLRNTPTEEALNMSSRLIAMHHEEKLNEEAAPSRGRVNFLILRVTEKKSTSASVTYSLCEAWQSKCHAVALFLVKVDRIN